MTAVHRGLRGSGTYTAASSSLSGRTEHSPQSAAPLAWLPDSSDLRCSNTPISHLPPRLICLLSQHSQLQTGKEHSPGVSLHARLVEYSHLKLFLHFQACSDWKVHICKPTWLKETGLPQKKTFYKSRYHCSSLNFNLKTHSEELAENKNKNYRRGLWPVPAPWELDARRSCLSPGVWFGAAARPSRAKHRTTKV